MTNHTMGTRAEWLAQRLELLEAEKEHTRRSDELTQRRQDLPWVKVDKPYVFDGPQGPVSLQDLFQSRSQLIVYHFMLGPGWKEGCPSCSYIADHFGGMLVHLAAREVTLAAVSRAPIGEIEAFRKRMGWRLLFSAHTVTDYRAGQGPR